MLVRDLVIAAANLLTALLVLAAVWYGHPLEGLGPGQEPLGLGRIVAVAN